MLSSPWTGWISRFGLRHSIGSRLTVHVCIVDSNSSPTRRSATPYNSIPPTGQRYRAFSSNTQGRFPEFFSASEPFKKTWDIRQLKPSTANYRLFQAN
ncbi:hypothetical protein PoB_007129700 [Plakobranchus ocellatus]|uniref:Uncharacterized protein n=1 Tax=Plakobranchus ocellatus TaxID=259542 RepID=A0AAV4DKI4_9GAST|nr:hypothetical protein PoB_007129700 [Plakobranchus ocellatus]